MVTGIEETVVLLKAIKSVQNGIKANYQKMDKKLNKIQSNTEKILKKDDREIIEKYYSAKDSLEAAFRSEVQSVRNSRTDNALNIFNHLIQIDPNETTDKTDNKQLIIGSYLGSFYSYVLLNDKNNAAMQVYKCVEKCVNWDIFPDCLDIFPTVFFSKDYQQLFDENEQILAVAKKRLQQLHQTHFQHSVDITSKSVVNNTIRVSRDVGLFSYMALVLATASILPTKRKAISKHILTLFPKRAQWDAEIDPIELDYLNHTEWLEDRKYFRSEILRRQENLKSLSVQVEQECKEKIQFIKESSPNSLMIKAWEYQINQAENYFLVDRHDGLKSQINDLKDALNKGDINSLQQYIKQINEMVKSVNNSAAKWQKIYSDIEECGLLT